MIHHILLVEDDGTHRAMAYEILTEMGYQVDAVDNGYAALSKISSDPEKFTLIIMDWEMPEMDGLEAARAIRKHQEEDNWPYIPIIAFTANKREGDEEKCLAAGMDDYMAKEVFMPKWRLILDEKINTWLQYYKPNYSGDIS